MSNRAGAVKQAVEKNTKKGGLPALIDSMMPQIKRALPKGFDASRVARIMITELKNNDKLGQCDPYSFLGTMMQACALGLEPGVLNQVYFVPYGPKVQMIIGHRGLIELARRTGEVLDIEVREVREGDEFNFEYGTNACLRHVPAMRGRGATYAYYCLFHKKGGSQSFTVMHREDVESIRKKYSKAKSGPWFDDFDAMARKTVIKRHMAYQPLSVELSEAVSKDEALVQSGPDLDLEKMEFEQVVDAEVVESDRSASETRQGDLP